MAMCQPPPIALDDVLAATLREGRAGQVTDRGRRALAAAQGRFTLGQLRESYAALLRSTWGDVIDDDELSAGEHDALALIVATLGLPRSLAPHARRALAVAV